MFTLRFLSRALVLVSAWSLSPGVLYAYDLSTISIVGDASAEVLIGVAGSPARPVACINNLVVVPIAPPGTALVEDVYVTTSDHIDGVTFYRTGMTLGGNAGCGLHNWTALNFDGYEVEVDLRSGYYNYFDGPQGSPDFHARGGAGSDWFYGYSSTGRYTGNEERDDFVMTVAVASGRLRAGDGDDCIELYSGSYGGTLDCGNGNDRHNKLAPVPASCETYMEFPSCGLI